VPGSILPFRVFRVFSVFRGYMRRLNHGTHGTHGKIFGNWVIKLWGGVVV